MYLIALLPGSVGHNVGRRASERHGGRLLTGVAMIAVRAAAVEQVQRLVLQVGSARAAVEACVRLAAGQLHRTVLAAEFRIAHAQVAGFLVVAFAVFTGPILFALVDIDVAQRSLVALFTVAPVTVDQIVTLAVETGITGAFVDVLLAIIAAYSRHTHARVATGLRVAEVLLEASW